MIDSSTENKQIDEAKPRDSVDSTEAEKKQPESKHKTRSVVLIIGLGLGAIALVFFGYRWWRYSL